MRRVGLRQGEEAGNRRLFDDPAAVDENDLVGHAPRLTEVVGGHQDAGAGGGQNQRSANTSKERQNFDVSETRRERVLVPGAIRRLSVAVMVDGIAFAPGAQVTSQE